MRAEEMVVSLCQDHIWNFGERDFSLNIFLWEMRLFSVSVKLLGCILDDPGIGSSNDRGARGFFLFSTVHTGLGSNLTFCPMFAGRSFISGGQVTGGVKLTNHLRRD
jgi:hypothetical protein